MNLFACTIWYWYHDRKFSEIDKKFNTLISNYMSQVLAVFLGGMSIFSGHVSAEQLMKYVFYCEWLIYAAWRLQDNMSSLLQSIGACEQVFQLMNISPSHQFLSKGNILFLCVFFLLDVVWFTRSYFWIILDAKHFYFMEKQPE